MRKSAAQAQALIFGGLMAALVIIFAFVPFLSFLMPIPLVLTYLRYGGRTALLTSIVATVFAIFFTSPDVALLTVLPMGVMPGLAFGLGFKRGWKPIMTALLALSVFFVGYAADYAASRWLFFDGKDPIVMSIESDAGRKQIDTMVSLMETALQQQPVATDAQKQQVAQVQSMLTQFKQEPAKMAWALLPSGLFLMGALFTWVNYLLCLRIIPRFGHQIPAPSPFGELRLPAWATLGYFVLMFGGQYVLQPVGQGAWWSDLARNVVFTLVYIFYLVGLAVVWGFLRKKDVPKGVALVLSILALVFLGQWLLIIAAWDAIFDFRQLGHGIWRRRPATES
ncbi:MAG TPA: DUF2232 domain-containing protein [Symbiobacteriaceae bacterium]|nr:DUF2232 domain-containing protein [Symbiobacteriaceae bacterium]